MALKSPNKTVLLEVTSSTESGISMMYSEEACLYDGDIVFDDVETVPMDGSYDTFVKVSVRGRRRQSFVDKTIHFPNQGSMLLSLAFRFSTIHYSSGLSSAMSFLNTISDHLLVDLLKSSTFLEMNDLVSCLCSQLARIPKLWNRLHEFPLHLIEEILCQASIETLVTCPFMQEKWWKALTLHQFSSQHIPLEIPEEPISPSHGLATWLSAFDERIHSPHVVIRKHVESQHLRIKELHAPTAQSPTIVRKSPILESEHGQKSIPTGVHLHLPSTDVNLSSRFWKRVYLQNNLQVGFANCSVSSTVEQRLSLVNSIKYSTEVMELILRASSPNVVCSGLVFAFLDNCLPQLESLDLSKVGLDGRHAVAIAEVLSGNKRLVRLNLGNNKLRNEGSTAIARIIKTTEIKTLHLEHNGLGIQAGIEIAEALANNQHLTKLALGYNQLRGRGVAAVCTALKTNTTLTALDVANCSIGNDGAFALAEMIKVNKTLTLIRAWDSSMGTEGGNYIATAVATNSVLLDVGVGYSSLSQADRQLLADSLARNGNKSAPAVEGLQISIDDPFASRRKHERDLLYGVDCLVSDTWYLMDEQWLSAWRSFVARDSKEDPPGPITSDRLIDQDGHPRPGLRKLFDYRGVSPQVYRLFEEIYGSVSSPVVRTTIDLYAV
ncbi:hypothetical protein RCL1_006893 [Eukaryota sp. TZLM3-RCL]